MVQITRLHNTGSVHQVTQTMKSNLRTTDKWKLPREHHHWNIPRLKFISIRNYLIYFGEFFNIMTRRILDLRNIWYIWISLKKHIIYMLCVTQLIITAIMSWCQSCIKQIYLLLANDKSYSLRHPINYLYYHSNNILPIDEILEEPDNYLNLNTIKSIICLP